ncbi:unnamed protein product [Symbiodinium necroappetens]|uniref:Uncharacterized protein n=1 Tax=Symbiodinium necroappetens TaxID=1628268 RepID=A0A813B1A8_9DINO|nr:unnamed protein product [Symbiodinium necroappetens]
MPAGQAGCFYDQLGLHTAVNATTRGAPEREADLPGPKRHCAASPCGEQSNASPEATSTQAHAKNPAGDVWKPIGSGIPLHKLGAFPIAEGELQIFVRVVPAPPPFSHTGGFQDAKKDLKELAVDEDKTFGEGPSSCGRPKRGRSSQDLSAQKPRRLEFSAKKSGASRGATDSPGQKSSDEGSSDDGGSDAEDLDIFHGKYATGRGSAQKASKEPGASAAGEERANEEFPPSDIEPEVPDEEAPGSGAEEPDEEMEPFSAVPLSVRKQIKTLEPKLLDALPASLQKHSRLHYSVLDDLVHLIAILIAEDIRTFPDAADSIGCIEGKASTSQLAQGFAGAGWVLLSRVPGQTKHIPPCRIWHCKAAKTPSFLLTASESS